MQSAPPPKSNVVSITGGALIVRRRPGRPRKVHVAPDVDERDYLDQVSRAADEFIAADPVLAASSDAGTSVLARIEAILRALAEESAAHSWDRLRLQREARGNAPQLSSRRIDGLLKIARLAIAYEEVRRASGEMNGATLMRLVSMLEVTIEETLGEVAEPAVCDRFMDRLHVKMRDAGFPEADEGAC